VSCPQQHEVLRVLMAEPCELQDMLQTLSSPYTTAPASRARLKILHERLNDQPSVTELCVAVGARERTLHLSCLEAFGRPPALYLGATAQRSSSRTPPSRQGDERHRSRGILRLQSFRAVAGVYRRQFGELPSATFAKSRRPSAIGREVDVTFSCQELQA
jgi:hypothetical protein